MDDEHQKSAGWLRSRSGLVLIGFLVIAAFFLWEEHKAHLLGALPYLLLLLCPLLHFFMAGMEITGIGTNNIRIIAKPAALEEG